jgi:peroxiredoxin Q/BCP
MKYFMISVDDPETNQEFAESLDSDFPLLSNPTKEVAEAYGVVTAERALPYRWTYIIGGDGKILKIDKEVTPGTAGQDLVAHMQSLGLD